MHYVWEHRLWNPSLPLHTTTGLPLRIISPGTPNTHAGPDFFNARILIDGHLWAGNVEIHLRASDWHRHHHTADPAYHSVILHVVDRDDATILRPDGTPIPQLRLPCSPVFYRHYHTLVGAPASELPCAPQLSLIHPIHLTAFTQALAYSRLYRRADHIRTLLGRLGNDWESTSYITVARALGFGLNGDCFERLAISTPLRVISRHADQLPLVEALLLGQSGLLDNLPATVDPYIARLGREHTYLAHKFNLAPMAAPAWKMARTRPANLPYRRIALLAAILHHTTSLHRRILQATAPDEIAAILSPTLSDYWSRHYTLTDASHPRMPAPLSATSIQSLTINVAATIQFAYGHINRSQRHTRAAVSLLASIPPEHNRLTDPFIRAGLNCPDALTSQALIELHHTYCTGRRCLNCRIGHRQLAMHTLRDI